MKSNFWKKGFFVLTLFLSILFGFFGITNSYLYMEFRRLMSFQKMDVTLVKVPKPLATELYNAAEFLICFAVPFGLAWLVYFVITRLVYPKSDINIDKSSKQSSLT